MSDMQLIWDVLQAQSVAFRNAIAYLIAVEASKADDPDHVLKDAAKALQSKLDELPQGARADLKEKVRAESNRIVEAAQAFNISQKK